MNSIKRLAATVSAALLVSVCVSNAEHLTIVGVNDTHSMILPDLDNYGGLLRQRALLDSVRAADKNVIAVHAGDNVQGTPFFTYFRGAVEYPSLDSLGYNYIITGNHEYDNGTEELYNHYSSIKCTKLNANYKFENKRLRSLFKPYDIVEVGGKRVAFIGVGVNLKGSVAKGNNRGIVYRNATKVASRLAKKLKNRGKADYVIMVSHIGYYPCNSDKTCDTIVVRRSDCIDAVIGGHSHTLVMPNNGSADAPSIIPDKTGKNIIVTQAGQYGKCMTILDLDLESGSITHKLVSIDSRLDAAASKYSAMARWIDGYAAKVDSAMNSIIAYSPQLLENTKVNGAGNWAADIMLEICRTLTKERVEAFLINGKGLRHSVPQGKISAGFIKSFIPFDNSLLVMRIKGKYLLDAFKAMAKKGGDCFSKELYVEYDSNADTIKALIDGKPINPDGTYVIGTIDFMYNGGDKYTSLSKGKPLFRDTENYSDRLIDYIRSQNKGSEVYKINADTTLRFVKN